MFLPEKKFTESSARQGGNFIGVNNVFLFAIGTINRKFMVRERCIEQDILYNRQRFIELFVQCPQREDRMIVRDFRFNECSIEIELFCDVNCFSGVRSFIKHVVNRG